MSPVLNLYQKLSKMPFGRRLFSRAIGQKAPYFKSLKGQIVQLENGYGKAFLRKRRSVENHIGTVHAIAMCNLCELIGGLTLDVTIPKNKRWIPKGMTVEYLQKATTHLTAETSIKDINWSSISDLPIIVNVSDQKNQVVMRAIINMYISDKV